MNQYQRAIVAIKKAERNEEGFYLAIMNLDETMDVVAFTSELLQAQIATDILKDLSPVIAMLVLANVAKARQGKPSDVVAH